MPSLNLSHHLLSSPLMDYSKIGINEYRNFSNVSNIKRDFIPHFWSYIDNEEAKLIFKSYVKFKTYFNQLKDQDQRNEIKLFHIKDEKIEIYSSY
jgi:hypothetical protein